MLIVAALAIGNVASVRAQSIHTVLHSTSEPYEHSVALHLVTKNEFTRHGVSSVPYWVGSDTETKNFPITFNHGGNMTDNGQFEWIVPEAFATTKTGSLLEFNAQYDDGSDTSHPNIVSNMCFITNNIGSGTHYPDYNTNDENKSLFNGSFDVKYYPNENSISNGTMTLAPGKFRVRLTSDILKKLQNSGITLAGRGVTYQGVNVVDPYAVFPGANSTNSLTVGGPNYSSDNDWWKSAIVLDKSLFKNAKAGFQIRVFTTPISDKTTADVYTGYPTNDNMSKTKLNQTDDETSQVYFQVITGTTDRPEKLIDKGWDYMNTDAVFTIDQETLDAINKNSDCIVQIIARDATIRKVSLAKVWSERQNIAISGEVKTFATTNDWNDTAEPTEREADRNTYIAIYTRNILGIGDVMAGDTIRIPVGDVKAGAKYQIQLFGDNKSEVVADRLCDLTGKIDLASDAQVIEYRLSQADAEKINTWVTKADGTKDHPKWYWIALRGKGFIAKNVFYDKNTSGIKNHDVYLDEDQKITTIGNVPNVNVHLKRKFTKGKWATIMFPFSLNKAQINAAFGPNCLVGRFQRSDINVDPEETSYTTKYKKIYLTSASVINANEPQMLKIMDDESIKDEYVFNNVDLSLRSTKKHVTNANYGNGYLTIGQFTMVGTYSKIPKLPKYAIILLNRKNDHHNNEMHQDFYYVGDNTIANGGKSIKGYHWYMYFGNGTSLKLDDYNRYFNLSSNPAKITFYFNDHPMFDDDSTTAITEVSQKQSNAKDIYNLQGQLVRENGNTEGLSRGMYIINGHKVIINH